MTFFEDVFGVSELSYEQTRQQLLQWSTFTNVVSNTNAFYPEEHCILQLPNGNSLDAGIFSFPSVQELRDHATLAVQELKDSENYQKGNAKQCITNVVGESRSMHAQHDNAVFQAASQFNLLEFPTKVVTPERGISIYEWDHTQGPACAIACAAGTAYRNYLVTVPPANTSHIHQGSSTNMRGQTRDQQFNALHDTEAYLMEQLQLDIPPWKVKNGYIESSEERLRPVNEQLMKTEGHLLEEALLSRLRIGVQRDTQVTDDVSDRIAKVTQTYNSAISIGYSMLPTQTWKPVASMVLKGTYEATLLVGVLKTIEAKRKGEAEPVIYLTKVGGGVFANEAGWIMDAIERAVEKVQRYGVDLDIRVTHYGSIESGYERLENAQCHVRSGDEL
jgi:hypothetical protein